MFLRMRPYVCAVGDKHCIFNELSHLCPFPSGREIPPQSYSVLISLLRKHQEYPREA